MQHVLWINGRWPVGQGICRPKKMYFAAERLAYFAVDSCDKIGQNGFAVMPSQDGEDKIFENIANGNWQMAIGKIANSR